MNIAEPVIVISDLDGTLLDHYTYQFDAARPALEYLKTLDIPLILNSSKTAAELIVIRQELDNHEPFIVENGAGIYLPKKENNNDAYEVVRFSKDRKNILSVLQKLRDKHDLPFTGFNDMDIETIVSLTGLTKEQAKHAKKRDFTEPLQWHGNASQWALFCTELTQSGLVSVKGGRFISVSGKVDKGQAMNWLGNYYQQQFGAYPVTIALGDSENDRQMLENADYPVLIRSPAHDLPDIKSKNLNISDKFGPEGWNTSVINLLDNFGLIK